MQSALTPRLWLTAFGVVSILAACNRDRTDTPRESGAIAEDPASDPAATKGKIPVSTKSEEARKLYDEGLARFDQIRFHDAREKFQQAAAKDPDFAMAHYQLALTSPSNKESQAHAKQALALADKASEGERLAILGLQAALNGDPAKALKYAQEAVQKYPEDERARLALSFNYSGDQEYEKAVAELQKAIELNPGFSPAYNALGYAYRPTGNNVEAEKAFKKYIELVPDDPNPYDSYAELLMKIGRFDESIAQYRKALAIDPNFTNSYYGIAADLMFQGKHAEALAEAQKLAAAARNDGDRRLAHFTRWVIYIDQGKLDQALQELDKQYALDSRIGDPAQMGADAQAMGTILIELGKPAAAERRFQQALDVQVKSSLPPDAKADAQLSHHYYLGRVALARNDLAAAKSHAAEYLEGAEAKQNDFRIRQAHELNGAIALQEKNFDQATSELEKANQQDPYVLYLMAVAEDGTESHGARARELYKKAAEANSLPTLNSALVRKKAAAKATS